MLKEMNIVGRECYTKSMSACSLANSIFDETIFYFLAKFTVFQILLFYLALHYQVLVMSKLLFFEVRLPVFEKKCEFFVPDE